MKKIHLVKDFDGEVMCGEVNPAYVTIDIAKVTCTDCACILVNTLLKG